MLVAVREVYNRTRGKGCEASTWLQHIATVDATI